VNESNPSFLFLKKKKQKKSRWCHKTWSDETASQGYIKKMNKEKLKNKELTLKSLREILCVSNSSL